MSNDISECPEIQANFTEDSAAPNNCTILYIVGREREDSKCEKFKTLLDNSKDQLLSVAEFDFGVN